MKKAGTTAKISLLMVLAIALTESANAELPKTQLSAQAKEPPPLNRTIKPLQTPIRLSPALQMRTKTPRMNLPIHLEQLQQQFNDLAGQAQMYEGGVALMPEIQKACAEKSYSVQDQMAAGCNGNETLNQCMEKLVHNCIETFSTPGMSWGGIGNVPAGSIPTYSTVDFRNAATQTAAKARTLSQKLQQYATQAERNAAAWK